MSDQKTIPQRILSWLHGEDIAATREQKGMFPFDPTYRAGYNWGNPSVPMYAAGTFGGTVDYLVEAGDLVDSSAVMACLIWLMRAFPQSRPRVVLEDAEGYTPVPNHRMNRILKKPNPFYSGTQLWRGTVLSYYWDGNAYWRKIRNSSRQVIQLYYEPHWNVRPVRKSSEDFVSNYQLWRYPEWVDVPTEDIVHFRWAFNLTNQMTGMAPLASALREVFNDNQAARYTAAMFRNLGVIGGLVTPKDDNYDLSGSAVEMKAALNAASTGDNAGSYVVLNAPVDLSFPPSDPGKMNTRENRKISEERISSLLGVPAQVAGLGAGLDRNILGSPEEALRWAYNNNVIPTQDGMAEELDIQLLPDFSSVDAETIEFDQAKIAALRGDQAKNDTVTFLGWSQDGLTRGQLYQRLNYGDLTDGTENMTKTQFLAAGGAPVDETQQTVDNSALVKTLELIVSPNGNGHKPLHP